MIDCHTGDWAREMVAELGLTNNILGPITSPATGIGKLRSILAEETGLPAELQVVAPGTHDTASAVAAVPAKGGSNWCYLSSGTWSLLGAEIDEPCVSTAAQAGRLLTNWASGGTIRFLKEHRRGCGSCRSAVAILSAAVRNLIIRHSHKWPAKRRRFAHSSTRPQLVLAAGRHAAEDCRVCPSDKPAGAGVAGTVYPLLSRESRARATGRSWQRSNRFSGDVLICCISSAVGARMRCFRK